MCCDWESKIHDNNFWKVILMFVVCIIFPPLAPLVVSRTTDSWIATGVLFILAILGGWLFSFLVCFMWCIYVIGKGAFVNVNSGGGCESEE